MRVPKELSFVVLPVSWIHLLANPGCLKFCPYLFSDQNRNKTNKPKNKVKKEEPVPAEIHSKEVQRLEALCEERTKQLKMVQLHLHDSNTAFDGMSTVVNYLANDVRVNFHQSF